MPPIRGAGAPPSRFEQVGALVVEGMKAYLQQVLERSRPDAFPVELWQLPKIVSTVPRSGAMQQIHLVRVDVTNGTLTVNEEVAEQFSDKSEVAQSGIRLREEFAQAGAIYFLYKQLYARNGPEAYEAIKRDKTKRNYRKVTDGAFGRLAAVAFMAKLTQGGYGSVYDIARQLLSESDQEDARLAFVLTEVYNSIKSGDIRADLMHFFPVRRDVWETLDAEEKEHTKVIEECTAEQLNQFTLERLTRGRAIAILALLANSVRRGLNPARPSSSLVADALRDKVTEVVEGAVMTMFDEGENVLRSIEVTNEADMRRAIRALCNLPFRD